MTLADKRGLQPSGDSPPCFSSIGESRLSPSKRRLNGGCGGSLSISRLSCSHHPSM